MLLRRRLVMLSALVLALSVALPQAGTVYERPGRFPLAGLWELLTVRAGWAGANARTPEQPSGGEIDTSGEVPAAATRADGGNGRPPRRVPGALPPDDPGLHIEDREPWTAPAEIVGFDPATSVRIGLAAGSTEVFGNADGSVTLKVPPVGAGGRWKAPPLSRLTMLADKRLVHAYLQYVPGDDAAVDAGQESRRRPLPGTSPESGSRGKRVELDRDLLASWAGGAGGLDVTEPSAVPPGCEAAPKHSGRLRQLPVVALLPEYHGSVLASLALPLRPEALSPAARGQQPPTPHRQAVP